MTKKLINKFKTISSKLNHVTCYNSTIIMDEFEKNNNKIETLYKKSKPFSLDQNIAFKNGGERIMNELNDIESFSKDLEEDILTRVSKEDKIINLFNKNDK